jgi:hypothetical protein
MTTSSLHSALGAHLAAVVLIRGRAQANSVPGQSQLCLKLGINPP